LAGNEEVELGIEVKATWTHYLLLQCCTQQQIDENMKEYQHNKDTCR
jgi:hypothetical protein